MKENEEMEANVCNNCGDRRDIVVKKNNLKNLYFSTQIKP